MSFHERTSSTLAADPAWFRPPPLRLGSAERVLRMQRYRDLTKVRPAIRRAAEQAIVTAERLQEPQVRHRRLAVEHQRNGVLVLADGTRFTCAAFDHLLPGCTEVVVFAMTIGPRVDQEVVELTQRGDLLEALMLEMAGWIGVEEVTRVFRRTLRADATARGLHLTRRLGPGYTYNDGSGGRCMWSLDQQQALFRAVAAGGGEMPVQVMASSAMLPKMSRSGLFGVTPIDPWAGAEGDEAQGESALADSVL